jgi:hypothetical protein
MPSVSRGMQRRCQYGFGHIYVVIVNIKGVIRNEEIIVGIGIRYGWCDVWVVASVSVDQSTC